MSPGESNTNFLKSNDSRNSEYKSRFRSVMEPGYRSRYSDHAAGWMVLGSNSGGARYFSLPQNIYKVGNLVISWGPGLDVNLSPSSNAEVKKELIPLYTFKTWTRATLRACFYRDTIIPTQENRVFSTYRPRKRNTAKIEVKKEGT
jgi:hypothetical protein